MRKILLFFLVFPSFICEKSQATNDESAINQLIKQVIPPSPTAAAFARYGEYPVSLSTGVPQIDIPIYTIDMRGFKLPISTSYHASGIKVTDVATPVGLGWVLNAGGIISRTTCGKCDLLKAHTMDVTSSTQINQYISNRSKPIRFWNELLSGTENGHDSQSDRYSYNFNGKSGTFRYDIQTGEIKTIPFSPISIKITDNGYKITDTDGMEYFFEQEEQSNVSSPLNLDVFTTSWYMSKIKNPNTNDSIRFVYKSGTAYNTYYPSQYVDTGVGFSYEYNLSRDVPNTYDIRINSSEYSWTRIFNLPILLDSIVWDNNIINFTYASDRLDLYKDRLTRLSISNNGTKIKEAVFGNGSYWGNGSTNYRMKLDNLTLQGTDNSNAKEKYSFTYDSTTLPDYYNMNKPTASRCNEDYWGYFNGNQSQYIIPDRYCVSPDYSTDRSPKEVDMKACSLTQITYPTGGKTIFGYEINKVTRAYDYNLESESEVGGLRIKTITNQDKNGSILGVKNYEYSGIATNIIRYAMYSSTINYIYSHIWEGDFLRNDSEHNISVAQPVIPLTDYSGSPVFYSTVTEYNGTSSNNSGKTVYKYMQDLDNLGGCESNVDDQLKFYSEFNNCDQGSVSPLLLSQTIYKKANYDYICKRSITNNYTLMKEESFITGVTLNKRDVVVLTSNGAMGYDTDISADSYIPYSSESDYYESLVYYDILAFRGISVLSSTSTTDYDDNGNSVTSSKNYSYDPALRTMNPIETVQFNSKGEVYTVKNTHPFDITGNVYVNMTTSNNVDPIVKSMEYTGSNLFKTTSYEYKAENGMFLVDNIQLAKKNNPLEKRIFYSKYDSYGNPLEVIVDGGKYLVYLWGYNEYYPVVKIEGLSYDDIKNIIGDNTLNLLKTSIANLETLCQNIRSSLSGKALVTSYTYNPLIGITSIIAPNSAKTKYNYDDSGRLVKTLDSKNNVIDNYIYNYQQ